jgi:hypothetical protein
MKTKNSFMKKVAIITYCLAIIISLLSIFVLNNGENHHNWAVATYKGRSVANHNFVNPNNSLTGSNFGATLGEKGKMVYYVKADFIGSQSVNWFYGNNGPQKMKLNADKKYFIVETEEDSFWAYTKNELVYAWFKARH